MLERMIGLEIMPYHPLSFPLILTTLGAIFSLFFFMAQYMMIIGNSEYSDFSD